MRRGMATAVVAAIVVASVLLAVEVRAQATPPSGETLLDNHVKAIGGKAAFDKLNNRAIKARMEVAAAGVSMAVSIWAARPNRIRTLVESDLVGRIERGFDGETGWEVTTTSGPRVIDGAQLDDLVRDSRFDGLAAWRDWVAKAETQGASEVNGKPAWKVLVTPKRGSVQTYYLDQTSSLAVKMETVLKTAAGDIPTESYMDDYRESGGVRLPHRVRQLVAGQELVTTLENVAHNTEIPAAQFDPPKEIQALVAKK